MHIRIMNIQSHLFREHLACHTTWHRIQLTLVFSGQKYKNDYHQWSQLKIRFLYLARVYLLMTNYQIWFLYLARVCLKSSRIRYLNLARVYPLKTNVTRSDSCILPGCVWRVQGSDAWILPGCIRWRLALPDPIPVSCQGVSVEDISRPRPVQLIDPKIFCLLSSHRPSLVQLNRPQTDFSNEDSVEVIQDFLNDCCWG